MERLRYADRRGNDGVMESSAPPGADEARQRAGQDEPGRIEPEEDEGDETGHREGDRHDVDEGGPRELESDNEDHRDGPRVHAVQNRGGHRRTAKARDE